MRIQNINNYNQYKNYSNGNNNNNNNSGAVNYNSSNPSFKGAKESKFGEWIGKMYAKYYAKPLYNQMWLHKFSKKLAQVPGSVTSHMVVLGSAITSGVYMKRTLDNKDLDPQKKQTLAINQGLCFAIPTVLSYWADAALNNWIKQREYGYSGSYEHKKALGKLSAEQIKEFEEKMGDRLKGVRTLGGLVTFTLIYRYASPVIITPIANWIGDKLNGNDKKDESKAKEVPLNANKSEAKAKEISINSLNEQNKEIKQSA